MPVQHRTPCAISQLFLKQVARQPNAPALKTASEVSAQMTVAVKRRGVFVRSIDSRGRFNFETYKLNAIEVVCKLMCKGCRCYSTNMVVHLLRVTLIRNYLSLPPGGTRISRSIFAATRMLLLPSDAPLEISRRDIFKPNPFDNRRYTLGRGQIRQCIFFRGWGGWGGGRRQRI